MNEYIASKLIDMSLEELIEVSKSVDNLIKEKDTTVNLTEKGISSTRGEELRAKLQEVIDEVNKEIILCRVLNLLSLSPTTPYRQR